LRSLPGAFGRVPGPGSLAILSVAVAGVWVGAAGPVRQAPDRPHGGGHTGAGYTW